MSISLRLSERESELIKSFAQLYGMSVSEYIRKTVMDAIEDEYDLKCYNEAMEEYKANPETCTTEELAEKLGIKL
ncbi:MAG: DUF6290 family protein [Roseburia sp.]|nr:DUF6290 family protein [Roseburia sp.]